MDQVGIPEFEEWRKYKLHNWGRWRWRDLMCARPDGSCANSFWDQIVNNKDGDGEETEETVRVVQVVPAKAELEEINDADAEVVAAWVKQLTAGHREILIRRYVFRERLTPHERDLVDLAIHAVLMLKHENRRVIDRMRHATR